MKKILTLIFLVNVQFIYCQTPCDDYNFHLNFEDTICLSHLTIDTTLYPQNIWQIGHAQKAVLDSTACLTTVIVTDTMQPYPINDTSVFIFKLQAAYGAIYGCLWFSGSYYVQTDSLKDYGKMEFSPDNGITWVDMINDTIYSSGFQWYSKPVLTGHSHTCKWFDYWLCDIGSVFNVEFGDTLIFRFTFISDSFYDNLGGLMYDDFHFYDFVEGISETRFKPIKSNIYPNPSADIFTIEFENRTNKPFQLSIYDIHSKLIYTKDDISENKIVVDAYLFKPGTYIYKLTNQEAKKRCWGKIIIAK